MKNTLLLLFLFAASTVGFAQEKETCRDVVYMKDGSVFRGKISEYQQDGELIMVSWSGGALRLASKNVKKIEQKCRDEKHLFVPTTERPYNFKETGWYHATRIATLGGWSGLGMSLQHSSGIQLNRMLGAGIGIGIENLTPWEDDVSTYPLFAEVRGYLAPKNITPFYALGLGWAFVGKEKDFDEWITEDWQGGLMAQAQIGYRIGNQFLLFTGLRLQRKTRNWTSWGGNTQGVDQILQKRFEFGLGILL